jgi:hypothetical protein
MFNRSAMLALFSALSLLASALAHAAGEFEPTTQAALVTVLSDTYGDEGFPDAAAEQSAHVAAECVTSYVIDGFSPELLRELDAASSDWQSLSKPVRKRVFERMLDAEAMRSCGFMP